MLNSTAVADHAVKRKCIHGDLPISLRIGIPIGLNGLAYAWHP